jgi:hypothetical protein
LFLGAAAWRLLGSSSSDPTIYWWTTGLCYAGLAIAGPAWIAGCPLPTISKLLTALGLVAAVFSLALAEKRAFDADEFVLSSWRREGNRLTHDGLGLSVAALPGWRNGLQPVVLEGDQPSKRPHTRLGLGEKAVFLQLRHEPSGPTQAKRGSSIIIYGGPDTFDSLGGALKAVHAREAERAARPGVKILSHARVGQINGVEAISFEYQDPEGKKCTDVVFRSGSHLLTIALEVGDEADRRQLNDFLTTICVTGRSTDFDD